jgi:hypothetical protein
MLEKKCEAQDYIMWNGVDLELYMASFDPYHIPTVLQFLQVFQWDKRAEKALECLVRKYRLTPRVVGKVLTPKEARLEKKPELIEPRLPRDIVGICPRCDNPLRGERIPNCETKKTGRLYVKICSSTNCTYYSELFKIDRELVEIEGD